MTVEMFKHKAHDFESGGSIHWPVRPVVRVEIPQVDHVTAALDKRGFKARVGDNCYEILNSKGDCVEVPFGDDGWEEACAELERSCGL